MYGIFKNGGTNNLTITKNFIGSLTTAYSMNAATASSAEQRSYGIFIVSAGGDDIIEENTIAGINNASTNTGSTAVGAFSGGIGTQGSAGTIKVRKNFISGITCSGGTRSIGIRVISSISTTVENNVVSLSSNDNSVFYGINHVVGTSVSYYFNTVSLGGTISANKESAAFYFEDRAQASNVSFNNNLMVNTRTGGTGKHYGYKNVETDATQMAYLQSNYNDYYVSGSGTVLAYYSAADRTTIEDLRTANSKDAQSISLNPGFPAISSPTIHDDYRGSASGLVAGTTISGLTTDYENSTRAGTSTMGAFEFASVWNGSAWTVSPTATYNAVINGNFSGAGFSCKDLIVNAGKQVTVTSSTLSAAGNLLLKSDAANGTATFIDDGGTISVTGTTSVQQYLTYGRNWYMSSPVSGATGPSGNTYYKYVEALNNGSTWTPVSVGSNFEKMVGYIAASSASGTISFVGSTGTAPYTGSQSISGLTSTATGKAGYNLVANPYPSYVNWDDTNNTKTNLGSSIWYRTKNTSNTYVFDTYGSGVGTNNNGSGNVTSFIPPMQAFWVKVNAGQTGTLGFTNTARAHKDGSNKFRAPSAANNEQKVIRLQVSNGTNSDEAIVLFNANATNGFDDYDAPKMSNNNVNIPEIFTKAGLEKIVINGLTQVSDNLELALGFSTGTAGVFSLKATEFLNFDSGISIILKDKDLNTERDLTDGKTYTFESGVTNTTNRFSLIFRALGVTTKSRSIDKVNVQVFANTANQITIIAPEKSTYSIYNAVGQKVTEGITVANSTIANVIKGSGVYVVQVSENGRSNSTRIILNGK